MPKTKTRSKRAKSKLKSDRKTKRLKKSIKETLLFDIDHTLLIPLKNETPPLNVNVSIDPLNKKKILLSILKERYHVRLLTYTAENGGIWYFAFPPFWLNLFSIAIKKWDFNISLFSAGADHRNQWFAKELERLLKKEYQIVTKIGVILPSCLIDSKNALVENTEYENPLMRKCKSVSKAYSLAHSLLIDDNVRIILKEEWPQLIFHLTNEEQGLWNEIQQLGSCSLRILQLLKDAQKVKDQKKISLEEFQVPFYVAGILSECQKKRKKHKDWTIRDAFTKVFKLRAEFTIKLWITKTLSINDIPYSIIKKELKWIRDGKRVLMS